MVITGEGRILVMDDEAAVRDVAVEILRSLGYQVESARDGAEVISLYARARQSGQTFDAVIMDLTVPGGMGGKETVKELREIDPEIKAIVSSGYSNDDVIADYEKYGFSGVIKKPYTIANLGAVVRKVMKSGS
jgi:CheY-like chemotaxis protein